MDCAAEADEMTERLLSDLTKSILRAMEAQGMSRGELARRLGLSPQYVGQFLLRPGKGTSLLQLVRMAVAVGLEVGVTLLDKREAEE